jgi:hemerythrin
MTDPHTAPPPAPLLAPRKVEWTEQLSVGVDEIDAQHRELYRRVDRFLAALAEKRGAAELEPLVRYLGDYVREHFAEEQRLMEFCFYPALGEHLEEHQGFEAEFGVLAEELGRTGPSFGLAKRLVALLVDWLDHHLATTDRQFGTFLAGHLGRRSLKPSA